jgi:hypothetical protein
MMAEQHQIWQGTVWTGLTSEEGERLCPEVLPWADPYIAALVEKHRWQAVLFALQPDTEEDEAFWDDEESLDDPVPPPPSETRYAADEWPALAPLAPFSPEDATDELVRQGFAPDRGLDEPIMRAKFLDASPGFFEDGYRRERE